MRISDLPPVFAGVERRDGAAFDGVGAGAGDGVMDLFRFVSTV